MDRVSYRMPFPFPAPTCGLPTIPLSIAVIFRQMGLGTAFVRFHSGLRLTTTHRYREFCRKRMPDSTRAEMEYRMPTRTVYR